MAGKPDKPVPDDEAILEQAWKASGDLTLIALEIGDCRRRNVAPPAWVHRALLDLATTAIDTAPYHKAARDLARYMAVRDAHDVEGLSWEKAKQRAAERLCGGPAAAGADHMWASYKSVKQKLRAAGYSEDDPDSVHWELKSE